MSRPNLTSMIARILTFVHAHLDSLDAWRWRRHLARHVDAALEAHAHEAADELEAIVATYSPEDRLLADIDGGVDLSIWREHCATAPEETL